MSLMHDGTSQDWRFGRTTFHYPRYAPEMFTLPNDISTRFEEINRSFN